MRRWLLAACIMGLPLAAQADQGWVRVNHAWTRPAMAGHNAVVYLNITEHQRPDRLIAVSSPAAARAELVGTVHRHGMTREQRLDSLPIQPGGTMMLKPGADHIVLLNLKHRLSAGDSVPVTLTFEKAGKVNAVAMVELAKAEKGGGYVRYVWHRPSTNRLEEKLGYVVPLPRWGWMIGTGIYLDGVKATLDGIDASASANIARTMTWIGAIALAAFVVITACALFLNVSEHRSADAKLKRLAQQVVESQEHERARLSRELHDGISQTMVSVKLLLESALARLERGGDTQARVPSAEAALGTALARLSHALREVRRISHALRPSMLDDLGLAAALEQLTRELGEESGIEMQVETDAASRTAALPATVNTALFRIAQEALTNILRHAQASHATLAFFASATAVTLAIVDDGRGFDVERTQADARSGIGLRNMRERLDALGGSLAIASQPGRTTVTATVPLPIPLSPQPAYTS